MTHFPHMMAFMTELSKEKRMYDFEAVNDILNACADEGMLEPVIEPIDDPSVNCDFYDWADVVGILGEIEPDVRFS